ncbi:putative LRR receptor-like serine/threonine-protein kinase-like [Capsicum annuum]|nr:putative LRR receptor-like serine/threonine-protein kinase-like [Capsicum annuum]
MNGDSDDFCNTSSGIMETPSHFPSHESLLKKAFPKRQRVVALALPNLQLQGTISPSLANLSFLRVLNLENNSFHGSIPHGIGHLLRLRVIDIQNNKLQGSIPTSLFQHQRVQIISLAFNELNGEMWKGPWDVQELRVLNLGNNSLTGTIPPNATKLMVFNLSGNRINGNIPKEIGNLSQLVKFYMYDNQLTGSIPVTLFNISSLCVVSLVFNSLSGPLLLDEGNIVSNLKYLGISFNQISGFIPSNICQLAELKMLSISYNNITGDIPRNIGCLAKLEEIYIGSNAISGTIPTSLGNISTLKYLNCYSNRIGGQIPLELGKLSNLWELTFQENYKLIGETPEAIFNISSLEIIAFNFNNLSGRIPRTTGLQDLPNLQALQLGHIQLEGEIPLFITNASKLEILELEWNFLTGTIPTNFGNLHELQILFLHNNQLTNEPREHELRFFNSLVECRMLRYLEVGFNPLNGVLPKSIGNLSSTIEKLYIEGAHINGGIATGIGNMSGFTTLALGENNLAGSIPSDVGMLKQLQGLYLLDNKLQGHIPEALCHLSNLVHIMMSGNELTGVIPECKGNLSMLQLLYLDSNKFSSKFPSSLRKMRGLLFLNLSQNSLEGEVPSDIGELKVIVELDLSGNKFSGTIPSKLGDLQSLKSLGMSNNSFSGSIPLSFSNLISLEFLDMSLNALAGTIPKSLDKLSYLKSINVSSNDLEGEIPNGGVFANSNLQSFLVNKRLCGMNISEVPDCAIMNPGKQSKSKKPVLKIVIPVVTSFLIFLLVSAWILKRKKKGKSEDVEKVLDIRTHQLISYREIQPATNNFDGSNLTAVGTSGSVYKGTLSGGSLVAIKVLDLENEQVCKRFDTECKVMRNVRHRNLVPVITTCSSDYIRAFVLKYMCNGSLENWLYREDCHLNLLQRVIVMLDAAIAIEYLHHGNDTPIVHRDLKPANVLLDEDMVAHVGDFGISKILAVNKSMAHTETLGTLGYIAPGTMMDVVDINLSTEEQITSKSEICIASMVELAFRLHNGNSRIKDNDERCSQEVQQNQEHISGNFVVSISLDGRRKLDLAPMAIDNDLPKKLGHNNSLFLHSTDTFGAVLILMQLTGTENYAIWTHAVWNDLKEQFDKVDCSRIFQIYRDIATVAQGLNEIYEQARDQILIMVPIPSLNKAYSMKSSPHELAFEVELGLRSILDIVSELGPFLTSYQSKVYPHFGLPVHALSTSWALGVRGVRVGKKVPHWLGNGLVVFLYGLRARARSILDMVSELGPSLFWATGPNVRHQLGPGREGGVRVGKRVTYWLGNGLDRILDTRATNHMILDLNMLHNKVKLDGHLSKEDLSTGKIKGIGREKGGLYLLSSYNATIKQQLKQAY